MEWAAINELIDPALLIVVAACWALGYTIKQTPRVPNWSIVYIVTLFAIVFVVSMLGFSAQSVLQGILCGAVAVYGNQLIKQTVNGKQTTVKEDAGQDVTKPTEQPAKVEQPKQEEKPAETKPAPAQAEQPKKEETKPAEPKQEKPAEQPKPEQPAAPAAVKQADISKHASVAAEFVVDQNGTITVKGEIPLFTENATALLLPAGKKELTFKADERLHWIIVGADAEGDKMAVIGIGSLSNNIANVTASSKALSFKAGYTKSYLDESHTFAPGNVYKVINNASFVEVQYKKGETFALWYRIAKTAEPLNTGVTMDWLTPRLGALVGISDADHTNKNILVEAR